eukprot:Gregarina_sp_Poly_1__674@NODE_115_length_13858_cov_166_056486_g102_i0_p5_GENE_NODE_115_length_13858_cov_166_056486_g102_i0NODE_115_length_13858_cov_166_056486_g102_i0_p5_ORF_typecomplete_len248_score30_69Proteasome/PF00227_26/7_4e37Utp12/PF04003_12/1_5e03Utp12/PF04003_12/0_83_NODE_115_length_13858_cov_166_056486_g102_i041954938
MNICLTRIQNFAKSMTAAVDRLCDLDVGGAAAPDEESVSMGTTLLAMKYQGGVLLAADSRTSAAVVVDRSARKINAIAENIYMARSGSAAHTQFVLRTIQHYLKHHQVELNAIEKPTVKAAASLARLIQYNNRALLESGLIVAGYDTRRGPQVFSLPVGGSIFESNIALAGSGSTYVRAMANEEYRHSMSKAEVKQLAIKLVMHAMHNDFSSGGMIRWVTIDESGTETGCVVPGDLPTEEEFKHARE